MLEAETTLRDMDRWKDRIELSLDSRQIFFLFFGCAVVACLVFVLGVMVGERVARPGGGGVATGPDPLAALDALGGGHEPGLSAIGTAPRVLGPTGPALAEQPPLPFQGSLAASGAAAATAGPLDGMPKAAMAAATDHPAAREHDASASSPKEDVAKTLPAKARYTLQLSSFEEKAEAERYAARLSADGYAAVVYAADVAGKGKWYRVRVGAYATKKEARNARRELEKREEITAYVARLTTAPAAASKP